MIYLCNDTLKNLIEKNMKHCCNVLVYDEVDSTNRIAKQLAVQSAPEGTLVIAHQQSAGRGRLGRSFFSPEGGMYMSLILRPSVCVQEVMLITVAAAVAAAETIDKISCRECTIKWVNDIYIEGKKVCGILTEGAFLRGESRPQYAILGVGINLTRPKNGYPAEIADRADAVFGDRAVDVNVKAELVATFADKFLDLYDSIHDKGFIDEYRRRSYLDGRTVTFERDGAVHTATVLGVDANAGLTVSENGTIYTLQSGDVSVKPICEEKYEQK